MYSTLKWFINMIYFNSEELKLRILENKELSNRWKKVSKSAIFTASCTTLPTPRPPGRVDHIFPQKKQTSCPTVMKRFIALCANM